MTSTPTVADRQPGPQHLIAASAQELTKVYGTGDTVVEALRGVTISFRAGEFTAIMGPSGSGKSTLMHCLAGLDVASGGRVQIGEVDLTGLDDKAMTTIRRDRIGFVFQAFNLVPTLTAAENITLPVDIAGREVDREWFDTVVDRLGIRDRLEHRPAELSGGQQQRVACARALVGKPSIIFGDEPTGNLDSRSSGEVLGILRAATDEFGQTVVIVTHDPRAASYADRVVFLADGQIVRELQRPSADDVFEVMKNLDEIPAPNGPGAAGAGSAASGPIDRSGASGPIDSRAGSGPDEPGETPPEANPYEVR
ncbi:ABC transporter ATP-binding protein [Gordonia soli]|uniref:Putative ABC transporter ATP-binding protein n=1 Tax=Gordonia soli NBRC 108243 TaxID=1223545 RepID=M0QFH6_9ACTN|nr:ABC transporter ATP-binding protein [Gordonia soli]GAC67214.1 putative ABC transporter ATP-binding protein [Gordonia soli NBRC 108243]